MKKYFVVIVIFTLLSRSLIAAEAGMPQLDPTYWASQAFWLVIVFVSIYVLISKIFIPKIKANIDLREDKMRKDLESAKISKEEAEKKLKIYNDLILKANLESKKIISESRQKINEEIQIKKEKIQKEIENETINAEKDIQKFKKESIGKINLISEEIAANLLKNILGEDVNKSSIKATVIEASKRKNGL